MKRWELHHADCRDAMRAMEAESVDAIVTDPPYGLAFMGREWDHGVPGVEFWREALRVAKPGAHLVAFGGTRTFHRLACAIEDAGWEMRDCLSWLYGSGFPKSLDVSKAIEAHETIGGSHSVQRRKAAMGDDYVESESKGKFRKGVSLAKDNITTAPPAFTPTTDNAVAWQGWGTALKPAWEPVILARKPLDGTVAANVLAHGTGAINVDACRIGISKRVPGSPKRVGASAHTVSLPGYDGGSGHDPDVGRWPANVALDEEAATMLDEQTGVSPPKPHRIGRMGGYRDGLGMGRGGDSVGAWPADPGGGSSRFFYCAKASRSERGEANTHPTLKPLALMRWLVRLVCPPGGLVLDPFNGSGSTGVAALAEGMRYVGCEREAEYVEIARRRLASPWEDDEPDEVDANDKPAPRAAVQLELWR